MGGAEFCPHPAPFSRQVPYVSRLSTSRFQLFHFLLIPVDLKKFKYRSYFRSIGATPPGGCRLVRRRLTTVDSETETVDVFN